MINRSKFGILNKKGQIVPVTRDIYIQAQKRYLKSLVKKT